MIEVLIITTLAITLQYVNVSDQHVYTLNVHTVKCQIYFKKNNSKINFKRKE